jgi:hypothetical protein
MVIIFIVVTTLTGLKQKIASYHFKDSTSQAPDISRRVIVGTYDDLWRAVLTSLNLRSKVVICPASISHVANFDHYILIDFRSSLALLLLLIRLLLSSSCTCQIIVFSKKICNRLVPYIPVNASLFCVTLFLWIIVLLLRWLRLLNLCRRLVSAIFGFFYITSSCF